MPARAGTRSTSSRRARRGTRPGRGLSRATRCSGSRPSWPRWGTCARRPATSFPTRSSSRSTGACSRARHASALVEAPRGTACVRRADRRPPEGFRGRRSGVATEHQRTYTGLRAECARCSARASDEIPDHPAVRPHARRWGRLGRDRAGDLARPWAFATDGGWTCGVHGIPTVGFAPGEERYAHTNRERLEVEEARWAFERYPHADRGAAAGY
jgi:hypothetical protein